MRAMSMTTLIHLTQHAPDVKRSPKLGPYPCGASRCICTKGGCDHLGALSEEHKRAIAETPTQHAPGEP